MMIRQMLWMSVLAVTLYNTSGCLKPGTLTNEPPKNPDAIDEKELKSAVLGFIDGKEIELAKDRKVTIHQKDVTAFQLDSNRSKTNDGPWDQEGTFILREGKQSYAVRFEISFRKVEGKFAFFDFKIDEAVKQ